MMTTIGSIDSNVAETHATYAERRLAEIKQKNAEAQRRRRMRLRGGNATTETSVQTANSERVDVSERRRQQNAEAQRRRRERLKQQQQDQERQEQHDEKETSNSSSSSASLKTTSPPSSNSPNSESWQVALSTIRKTSEFSSRKAFPTSAENGMTMGDVYILCNMFSNYQQITEDGSLLMHETMKRSYAGLFGGGCKEKEEFPYNHIVADYLQYKRACLGLTTISTCLCNWPCIPENMHPTSIQLAYSDHPTSIDLYPWPSFRDRLVLLYQDGAINMISFYTDNLQHPLLTGKDVSYILHGEDPYNADSWEVSEWFFIKYRSLFDQEILNGTNFWRALRGERLLFMQDAALYCTASPIPRLLTNGTNSEQSCFEICST